MSGKSVGQTSVLVIPEPLQDFLFGFPIWAIGFVVSARFFRADLSNRPVTRFVSSAHGVLVVVAYAFACLASAFTRLSAARLNEPYELVFGALLVLAFLSVAASFITFAGPRHIFLYHLLTVPALVAAALFGGLVLSHDSL